MRRIVVRISRAAFRRTFDSPSTNEPSCNSECQSAEDNANGATGLGPDEQGSHAGAVGECRVRDVAAAGHGGQVEVDGLEGLGGVVGCLGEV